MAVQSTIEAFIESSMTVPARQIEFSPQDSQQTITIRGRAPVPGAQVEYTYEQPLDYITDDTPLIIVNGYMGTEPAYDRWRKNTAQLGRAAITLQPVRKLDWRVAMHPDYAFRPGALPSRALYGVMKDMQTRYGYEQFDMAGHSMGGWVASMTAVKHPEKVRSITYVAAAGLEDHSLVKMLGRLPGFYHEEFKQHMRTLFSENHTRLALDSLHYVLRRPLRTLAEGVGVSECDIRPTIKRLGEAGIRLAALNFVSDKLVPNKAIEQEIGHLFDYCAMHPDETLGHLAPQLEPLVIAGAVLDINHRINGLERHPAQSVPLQHLTELAVAEVAYPTPRGIRARLPYHCFDDSVQWKDESKRRIQARRHAVS